MVAVEDAVTILLQTVATHHIQAQLKVMQVMLAGRVPLVDGVEATATNSDRGGHGHDGHDSGQD